MRSMKTLLALLMTIFVASCSTNSTGCEWAREIVLSKPTILVLQRGEAEQIVAHNRKVEKYCR